jgi:hypothetical protein
MLLFSIRADKKTGQVTNPPEDSPDDNMIGRAPCLRTAETAHLQQDERRTCVLGTEGQSEHLMRSPLKRAVYDPVLQGVN